MRLKKEFLASSPLPQPMTRGDVSRLYRAVVDSRFRRYGEGALALLWFEAEFPRQGLQSVDDLHRILQMIDQRKRRHASELKKDPETAGALMQFKQELIRRTGMEADEVANADPIDYLTLQSLATIASRRATSNESIARVLNRRPGNTTAWTAGNIGTTPEFRKLLEDRFSRSLARGAQPQQAIYEGTVHFISEVAWSGNAGELVAPDLQNRIYATNLRAYARYALGRATWLAQSWYRRNPRDCRWSNPIPGATREEVRTDKWQM